MGWMNMDFFAITCQTLVPWKLIALCSVELTPKGIGVQPTQIPTIEIAVFLHIRGVVLHQFVELLHLQQWDPVAHVLFTINHVGTCQSHNFTVIPETFQETNWGLLLQGIDVNKVAIESIEHG